MTITNSQFRLKLPVGIVLDSLIYPDASSCLPAVMAFLDALENAQVDQNATAPSREDVQIISVGRGAEIVITRDGQNHRVKQVTRSVTAFEKQTVSEVFPLLV